MKNELLKGLLSALEDGSEMALVVARLIEASSDDYEGVILALIGSRNVPALTACMRYFPPVEALRRKGITIRSPFEILVCDVKEITKVYKDLLREIVVYLDTHRQDLLTYCSKKNILEEIWWVAADLECIDHFNIVATHHTFPDYIVEDLHKTLRSYDSLDMYRRGKEKPIKRLADCTEDYRQFVYESRGTLGNLVCFVGNLSFFEWYIENPIWRRYLKMHNEYKFIFSVVNHVTKAMLPIIVSVQGKGPMHNEDHHLVVMVKHGISVGRVMRVLTDVEYEHKGKFSHKQLDYIQNLRRYLPVLEPEGSFSRALSVMSRMFSCVSPSVLSLASSVTQLPGLQLDDSLEKGSQLKLN